MTPLYKELTAAEIGNYGERHVTNWLSAKGFRCYQNTQQPGCTDIDAKGNPTCLFVQVKTAIYPSLPASLSADERTAIVRRANNNNREAWLAQVSVSKDGNLIGEITWTKLN